MRRKKRKRKKRQRRKRRVLVCKHLEVEQDMSQSEGKKG